MGNSPQLNRDLKAGRVFADLLEQGVFDEEFEYFGFAFWEDEEIQFLITNNEQKLYDELGKKVAAGTIVTPVLKIIRRLMISELEREQSALSLQTELKQNLLSAFPLSYFKNLAYFSEIPNQSTAYPVLAEYIETLGENLTIEKWKAFVGLVKMAVVAKKLDKAHSNMLLNSIKTPVSPGCDKGAVNFYGFAYLSEDNQWRYYVNGYRPGTIAKKIELSEKMIRTTPILDDRQSENKGARSKYEIKTDFLNVMKDALDVNYLELLEKIVRLNGTINKEEFLSKLKAATPDIDPLMLKSLQGYRSLWHIY